MATTGQGFLARLPRVGKCCDCIALRTGTIILGVLGVVGFLLWFAFCLYVLLVVYPKLKDDPEFKVTEIHIYSHLVASLVCLGFSILLLIGAINRKPVLLKIYMIFNLICVVLIIVAIVLTFFAKATVQQILFKVFQYACSLFFAIYFWVCVNSYLQQILEERQTVAPENVRFRPV